jgi:hypothetical protein
MVKCSAVNATCSDAGEDNTTTGILPKDVSYVQATISGLTDNTTYWCFVAATVGKASKCQGPLEATTSDQPAPVPLTQANLFGSNFGNNNGQTTSAIFTKNPIVNGSYNAIPSQNVAKVSLSGIVGAILQPVSVRRRHLMAAAQKYVRVTANVTDTLPVFVTAPGTESLDFEEISLSGNALTGVSSSKVLYYTSNVTSGVFTNDTTHNFTRVSLSNVSVLAFDDSKTLWYTPDIGSASWQMISTSGMNFSTSSAEISLSGSSAALTDSGGNLYYASDITAANWVLVPNPTGKTFVELSLTGLQIVAVDTSLDASGNNVLYSDDISTVTSSSWILIGGALRSVAISVP